MYHHFDPHEILGVPKGAAQEAIKAAFRQKAKQHHPDLNGGACTDEFIRVHEAYEYFERDFEFEAQGDEPALQLTSSASEEGSDEARKPIPDVVQIVRDFMKEHDLDARFDGEFVQTGAIEMAHSPGDIDRVLDQEEWDGDTLVNALLLHIHQRGVKVPLRLVCAAMYNIKREGQRQRVWTVIRPLLTRLSSEEQLRAEGQWRQFVETAFDMPPDLGIAVLKKFVHQVRNKRLKRPITRHLMPIFQSEVQGGGKTTAALRFLAPLQELRTEPALLSDFADKRSGDVYRYPVLFVDDMEQISPGLIPTLKSLVTGQGLLRRKMGGSGSKCQTAFKVDPGSACNLDPLWVA